MGVRELAKQDIEDIAAVARTKEGARLFARIITEGEFYNDQFIADPMLMQFRLGKRSMAIMILQGLTLEAQKLVNQGKEERKYIVMGKVDDNGTRI